ncbi:hypothetical protein [Catenulispora rubra]|uniref:hypothetical protein n=1 Tax=Catenulispora rubra TaxID=280293 RepID=UPI00189233D7|nr:hypothetical protein [Catenulispora rubra]
MGGDGPRDVRVQEAVKGLAENPALPPDMVFRLLAWPGELRGVAERPDLTDAMVAEIIARDNRWQVHALALNPWLCHKFRMLLARHGDPGIRAAVVVGGEVGAACPDQRPDQHSDQRPDQQSGQQSGQHRDQQRDQRRELFEALIDDDSREVRETLARTEGLPADLRARLAADPDPQIRVMLAQWWSGAPENVREALLGDPDEKVRSAAFSAYFRYLVLDDTLIDLLARDPESAVRAQLAARPDLPEEMLSVLTRDPSPVVRLAVFARPDTPVAVRAAVHADITDHAPTLDDLIAADDEYGLVFEYLQAGSALGMLRPAWVTAEAERHVDSPYPCFRAAAALSTKLPIETVRRLLDDEDEQVRMTMVRTAPHLVDPARAERIERLHQWDDLTMWWEYEPVLTHSAETMERFAVDPEPRLRALASGHPDLSADLAVRLAADPEASVRAAVAGHRNLPTANLAALLADASERVVHAAAASPHLPLDEMDRLLVRAGL